MSIRKEERDPFHIDPVSIILFVREHLKVNGMSFKYRDRLARDLVFDALTIRNEYEKSKYKGTLMTYLSLPENPKANEMLTRDEYIGDLPIMALNDVPFLLVEYYLFVLEKPGFNTTLTSYSSKIKEFLDDDMLTSYSSILENPKYVNVTKDENIDQFSRDLLVAVLFVVRGLTFSLRSFWYDRAVFDNQLRQIYSFQCSSKWESADLLNKKILEVEQQAGQALKNNCKHKKDELKAIGLKFNEPIPSKAWGLIALVLVTKELCEILAYPFYPELNRKASGMFDQFCYFSHELCKEIDLPVLSQEIIRLRNVLVQKREKKIKKKVSFVSILLNKFRKQISILLNKFRKKEKDFKYDKELFGGIDQVCIMRAALNLYRLRKVAEYNQRFFLKPFLDERERLDDEIAEISLLPDKLTKRIPVLSYYDLLWLRQLSRSFVSSHGLAFILERIRLVDQKIFELEERAGRALVEKRKLKQVELKQIGVRVNEPVLIETWGLIAWVLATKEQIKELCEIPNDKFSEDDRSRLRKRFDRFVRFSDELDNEVSLPGLSPAVSRLDRVVKQKHAAYDAYREKYKKVSLVSQILNLLRNKKRDF